MRQKKFLKSTPNKEVNDIEVPIWLNSRLTCNGDKPPMNGRLLSDTTKKTIQESLQFRPSIASSTKTMKNAFLFMMKAFENELEDLGSKNQETCLSPCVNKKLKNYTKQPGGGNSNNKDNGSSYMNEPPKSPKVQSQSVRMATQKGPHLRLQRIFG
jgi:hypothetical protein